MGLLLKKEWKLTEFIHRKLSPEEKAVEAEIERPPRIRLAAHKIKPDASSRKKKKYSDM